MKLTFTPAPDSPWRVITADDPQPEESWSAAATNKRVASSAAPATQANAPVAALERAASDLPAPPPGPCATEHPSDPSPARADAADPLEPLPPGSCPHCPDRPLLFQARQQANYYRAMFRLAKQREAAKG